MRRDATAAVLELKDKNSLRSSQCALAYVKAKAREIVAGVAGQLTQMLRGV